jgi:hypothetical protein
MCLGYSVDKMIIGSKKHENKRLVVESVDSKIDIGVWKTASWSFTEWTRARSSFPSTSLRVDQVEVSFRSDTNPTALINKATGVGSWRTRNARNKLNFQVTDV